MAADVTRDAKFSELLKFMRKDHPEYVYLSTISQFEVQRAANLFFRWEAKRIHTCDLCEIDGNKLIGKRRQHSFLPYYKTYVEITYCRLMLFRMQD